MEQDRVFSVPVPTIRRLPQYLSLLKQLQVKGREVVSCTHIANDLSLQSVQVRKDLAVTGIVGKPKIGYEIEPLINAIEEFLGWNNVHDAFVVGAGNLGSALLGYTGFSDLGFNILAAFDKDANKVGTVIHGKEVYSLDKLPDLITRLHVHIAVLTVPASAAQEIANTLVACGIKAIWNYSPATLGVPKSIIVENVRLTSSLAVLSSKLVASLKREDEKETGGAE